MALTRGDLRSLDLLFESDNESFTTIGDLLRAIATRPAWTAHAACRGYPTEWFFPTRGEPAHEAKAVCRTCPVASQCYEYAMADRHLRGVWSQTTQHERRKLREANSEVA